MTAKEKKQKEENGIRMAAWRNPGTANPMPNMIPYTDVVTSLFMFIFNHKMSVL